MKAGQKNLLTLQPYGWIQVGIYWIWEPIFREIKSFLCFLRAVTSLFHDIRTDNCMYSTTTLGTRKAALVRHYEKSYTGMNVFRKGMNSFRNGMNMFRTGMKTFRIGTGIRGNQNYQKIRNFSGSKNLKEFFQNSNF